MAIAKMAPFCCGVAAHIARGIDSCKPTPCATPCRVRIATHHGACQRRMAADGGDTMKRPLCRLHSREVCAFTSHQPVAAGMRRHAICAASPLPWH